MNLYIINLKLCYRLDYFDNSKDAYSASFEIIKTSDHDVLWDREDLRKKLIKMGVKTIEKTGFDCILKANF